MQWQTAWNGRRRVHRRDSVLNAGLENEKEFSRQRAENRYFRKREDQLKIRGLAEQSELGELQEVLYSCRRECDGWEMEERSPERHIRGRWQGLKL